MSPPAAVWGALAQATVDVTSYVMPMSAAALRNKLRSHLRVAGRAGLAESLELDTPAGFGERHPVVLERWDVRDGVMRPWGLEQDAWARLAGAAVGTWAAMAWNPWAAALARPGARSRSTSDSAKASSASLADGLAAQLVQSAVAGSVAGARAAVAQSESARARFGHYAEMILMVPYVRAAGLDEPVSFVVGMHTDSRFAHTLDKLFSYGFGKRMARIQRVEGGLRVESPPGRRQLQTSAEQTVPPGACELPSYWDAPLLGVPSTGRLALTRLTRTPSTPPVGVHVTVETDHELRFLLPEPSYRLQPPGTLGELGELGEPSAIKLCGVDYQLYAPRYLSSV